MEINKFKMVADFNIWSLSHDDEIYTITTEDGEVLFDVIEEDFLTMVDEGIVNHEGSYYLLNHPSEEQIREYAARWGILWDDQEDFVNAYKEHLDRFKTEVLAKIFNEVDQRGEAISFPEPHKMTDDYEMVLLKGISICEKEPHFLVFHMQYGDVDGDYLTDFSADDLLGVLKAIREFRKPE